MNEKRNTSILLFAWVIFVVGLYLSLWLLRFLEPWQDDLPTASAKEGLKFLASKIGLW